MAKFCINLAGIVIEVNAFFDSTASFCKDYLTNELPLFSVEVTQSDIDFIRLKDSETAIAEGRIPAEHSNGYLETLALGYVILKELISYQILMFHGSAIVVDEKVYLFTAKSGTGKTTHCNLWLKNFPGSYILNGDKPLLLFKDNKAFVCGSPWMGKEQLGVNKILPLEAICILERNQTNHISSIEFNDCLDILMHQCFIPKGNKAVLSILKIFDKLASVKFYRLGCNMNDEASFVSYNAMVKK